MSTREEVLQESNGAMGRLLDEVARLVGLDEEDRGDPEALIGAVEDMREAVLHLCRCTRRQRHCADGEHGTAMAVVARLTAAREEDADA